MPVAEQRRNTDRFLRSWGNEAVDSTRTRVVVDFSNTAISDVLWLLVPFPTAVDVVSSGRVVVYVRDEAVGRRILAVLADRLDEAMLTLESRMASRFWQGEESRWHARATIHNTIRH